MKKELFATLTIIALIIGAIVNVIHLKTMVTDMEHHINRASQACASGQFTDATNALEQALTLWLDADGYTHMFLRHSEIDTATDAFYDAMNSLRGGDAPGATSALEKLSYHLQSILSMEYVTLRSIF